MLREHHPLEKGTSESHGWRRSHQDTQWTWSTEWIGDNESQSPCREVIYETDKTGIWQEAQILHIDNTTTFS